MSSVRDKECGVMIDTLDGVCRDDGLFSARLSSITHQSGKGKGKAETSFVHRVHLKAPSRQHQLSTNDLPSPGRSRKCMIQKVLDRWKLPSKLPSLLQQPYAYPPDCYFRTAGSQNLLQKQGAGRPVLDVLENHKNVADGRTSDCNYDGGIYFENFSNVYPLIGTPPSIQTMSGQLDGASYLPFQAEEARATIALSTARASGRNHTRAAPPAPITSRKRSKASEPPSFREGSDSVQGNQDSSHMVYQRTSFSSSTHLTEGRLGNRIRELEETKENKIPLYWAVTYNSSLNCSSPATETPEECACDYETQALTVPNIENRLSQANTEAGNEIVDTKSSSESVTVTLLSASSCTGGEKNIGRERKHIPIIAVKPVQRSLPVISLDGHLVLDYSKLDGKCDCAKEILLERTRTLLHWLAFKAGQYLNTDPLHNCVKCTNWLGIDHSQRLLLKRVSLKTTDVHVKPCQLAAAIGIIRRYAGKVNSAKVDFPPDIGLYTAGDIGKLSHCLKTLQEILPFDKQIHVRHVDDNPKLGERWRRVGRKNPCEVAVRWIKQDIKNVSRDVRKGIRLERVSRHL